MVASSLTVVASILTVNTVVAVGSESCVAFRESQISAGLMRVRTERAEIAGEVVIVLKRRHIALRLLLRLAARLRLGCLRIVRVAIIRRVTAPDVADRTGRAERRLGAARCARGLKVSIIQIIHFGTLEPNHVQWIASPWPTVP